MANQIIGISTQIYDPNGAVLIRRNSADAEKANRTVRRRVSRTATLDGGCSVYDGGFSDSDRDIQVEVMSPEKALFDALGYLCRTYALLVICTEDGAFLAAPDVCQLSGSKLRFNFLVKEKLSA